MRESHNVMLADWRGNRTAKRASLGMYFDCIRYKDQVTANDCKLMTRPLCRECATGARIRIRSCGHG